GGLSRASWLAMSSRCPASLLALAALAPAQDMLFIADTGSVFAADASTLTNTLVGPGRPSLHGLTSDGATYWSCEQLSSTQGLLVSIDPLTGVATTLASTLPYVALAWDQGTQALYGLRSDVGANYAHNIVDRIDPATGNAVQVAARSFGWPLPSAL